MSPSEEEVKAQEAADKEKSDKEKGSGEKDFVSKAEFEKQNARLEAMAKKNEELVGILTSPNFMRKEEPKPEPKPEPKVEEKLPTQEEITDNPSKLVTYIVSKVGTMLDDHSKKQDERDKNISASIQKLVETDEDRETQRQIKSCIQEFGEKEFDDQRGDMIKISGQYPGISARDCFMIAVGKKNPPKKAPIPTATETEKTGQEALFKDADLSPKEAVEKAFEMHGGGKK